MLKKYNNKDGFTMIEVMAGMILLSVGLLMLMPLMTVSIRGNDFARGSTESSMLIREKIEDLKNAANPVSGTDTTDTSIRSWTVTDAGSGLRRIQVQLSWTDSRGRLHSNSMVTYTMP
jgi:prepilin-type N-terminal cleavage/methylation domain-containing protein